MLLTLALSTSMSAWTTLSVSVVLQHTDLSSSLQPFCIFHLILFQFNGTQSGCFASLLQLSSTSFSATALFIRKALKSHNAPPALRQTDQNRSWKRQNTDLNFIRWKQTWPKINDVFTACCRFESITSKLVHDFILSCFFQSVIYWVIFNILP